jgi:hypothetical protein
MDAPTHIRVKGYQRDRRFYRTLNRVRRVSSGGTICGAPETPDDVARVDAEAGLRLAALAHLPGGPKLVAQDVARLCPACVAGLGSK